MPTKNAIEQIRLRIGAQVESDQNNLHNYRAMVQMLVGDNVDPTESILAGADHIKMAKARIEALKPILDLADRMIAEGAGEDEEDPDNPATTRSFTKATEFVKDAEHPANLAIVEGPDDGWYTVMEKAWAEDCGFSYWKFVDWADGAFQFVGADED